MILAVLKLVLRRTLHTGYSGRLHRKNLKKITVGGWLLIGLHPLGKMSLNSLLNFRKINSISQSAKLLNSKIKSSSDFLLRP